MLVVMIDIVAVFHVGYVLMQTQERQCKYNVIVRGIRAAIVPVEKQ
jgi:hypothetical protein